ncbi:MAG: protein kinase, partial [Planctomycetes bacterium]|nr:protein kinase [Planctomycetota bacterium]
MTGSQTDATHLADIQVISLGRAIRVVSETAEIVRTLHRTGRLHREISVHAIVIDQTTQQISLVSVTEKRIPFGGESIDQEVCPPELRGAPRIQVSSDLSQAQSVFLDAGLEIDPRRIDVYQIGVLLWQLLTKESISSFLSSPRVQNQVPLEIRGIIEQALGHNEKKRFSNLDQLVEAVNRVSVENSDEDRLPSKSPANVSLDALDDAASSILQGTPDQDTDLPAVVSSPTRTDQELPFTRLGHYEIVGRIGHGGMGDVYKGYEKDLDRTVAIKVLPADFARQDEFVKRFYAEATAAAKLSHPNVIRIHFIGEENGHHYFAMQYVDGESLADLLSRRKSLNVEETLTIVKQSLAGLAAAHRQGLVHRDIKPGNILMSRKNSQVLLADFGLVKTLGSSARMTATGVVMGTVDYISPEQGRGKEVDGRSDLYSMGVLMYQMLSGHLPFEADTPTAMIFQHVYENPRPLGQVVPGLSPVLVSIVEKLMAKSPGDRYQNPEEVLKEIRIFRAGEIVPSEEKHAQQKQSFSDDSGQSPHRQTSIIHAPRFEESSFLSEGLTRSMSSNWWQRIRDRLLDVFQVYAPELVNQLQNTQQQMNGAVAEYERRKKQFQNLAEEADAVLQNLRDQAENCRTAAQDAQNRADVSSNNDIIRAALQENAHCEQTALELDDQIVEQQEQLESIQLRLAQFNGRLQLLVSRRGILQARLKTAEARFRVAGGRIKKGRPWIRIAAITCCAGFVAGMIWILSSQKSGESRNPDQNGSLQIVASDADAAGKQELHNGNSDKENTRNSIQRMRRVRIIPSGYSMIAESGFNDKRGISRIGTSGGRYRLNSNLNYRGGGELGWQSYWEATDSLAFVQDEIFFEGDGALWIRTDQANVSRQFRTQNGKFIVEQRVRIPVGGSLAARVRDESFGPFSKMGIASQWGVSSGGYFTVVDGVGDGCPTGKCEVENTGISWKADEWYKVSIVLDVASQTYEFFVNDVRYHSPDPLGFRGKPEKLDEVHYATPSAAGAYIDALRLFKSSDSVGIIRYFYGYAAVVNSVKFSRDGQQVISAGDK